MTESIGGQAVIEGVMMKSKDKIAVAVRKEDGSIVHQVKNVNSWTKKYPWKLPFIRGIVVLVETLGEGMSALNYSANEATPESEKSSSKFSSIVMVLSIITSFVIALFLFKFLPLGATQLLSNLIPWYQNTFLFNLTEGIIKLAIFGGYLILISFMPDIKRTFEYHGAEHKTVYCNEAGEDLTIENARKYSTLHPRCGTAFLLFVILLSIIVYMFIPLNLPFFWKLGLRILLLPLIASVSYEFIKLSGKYSGNKIMKVLMAPGLWLQKITTKEPSDDQLEVAIEAMKLVKE